MTTIFARAIALSRATAIAIAIIIGGGCSKDEITKLADQVKDATVQKIDELEKVAPILPKTGEIQLTIDAPTLSRTGYASLVRVEVGRPAVLQIRSFPDPARETFPAIFFQGSVPVDSVSLLAGKTVSGKLFVQTTAGASLWFSEDAAGSTMGSTCFRKHLREPNFLKRPNKL